MIEEYVDEHTGVRLTVEYDISGSSLVTIFWSENDNLEEINAAIRRLQWKAGLLVPHSTEDI
jgi:hypothetical protein